ncbi:GNAT family N-acetyltransferase [Acerihabitans arboris]|uniref:GNAT family N-acetyltransferase n=1 Tax=Acerihabitans arboris TaxID=2691583 RepID=A0A845SDH9_9GAMM|nr:GNAT family N-acetyltransferase [Acerihabitans arboris]NDL62840.1 GNAT family N-acetyltransferase [Acerihabitans arboris]
MFQLRAARIDELAKLTELCLQSTALLGYDDALRHACRERLTFRPADMENSLICVAAADNALLGAAQLLLHDEIAFLERLFVAPANAKTGIGKTLFGWSINTAHRAGAERLLIDCHPLAAGFYQRMGARAADTADPGPVPGGHGTPRFRITLTRCRAADKG